MRESRTYGSGRGACHEMHVPTATDGANSSRCWVVRRRCGRSRRGAAAGRMRRIGVLSTLPADDAEWQARFAALLQGLGELGWTVDRNVRIDYRLGADNAERLRGHVAELVALTPDVILANGTSVVGPLLQATRSVPIVFTNVVDPVGAGFVASLARPGRQRDRLYGVRVRHEREVARGAETDLAPHDARGSHSGSRHSLREWAVRGHPGGRAAAGRRSEPGRRARRWRDRARRHGIRTLPEWRLDP